MTRRRARFSLLLVLALVLAAAIGTGAGIGSTAKKKPKPKPTLLHPGPAYASLVAAAKKEGSLTFYTVPPDSDVKRVVDAFTKKFGIQAKWVRFTSADLAARYGAEMQAGGSPADMMLVSNSTWVQNAIGAGLLRPLTKSAIPGYPRGYPKKFLTNSGTAVVQLVPNGFAINTDQLKGAAVPKNWPDLLKPQYKGKILLVDPRSSPAYNDIWWLIQKKYGMDYIKKLRAQAKSTLYSGALPITNAVAAGEGAIGVPSLGPAVAPLAAKGAPVSLQMPTVTTGPEIVLALNPKASHPAAARLFADFLLLPRGQNLLDEDPGASSVWNTKTLPKGYTRVDPNVSAKSQSAIYQAFGVS